MKHVIVGTAGHVDHGKTTLIRALTGIETDRLREEQQRGISIEIGFAYFDLPSGRRAGIIDVPGHERFIKNMLAGIAGVDLALLVVAADEGVMPQTVEHLNILSLLQIQQGLVVITKRDLVEADWLELVEEEVRERLQGSFLENAEILAVSATTGEGLPALVAAIDRLTSSAQERDSKGVARLPVDRVFSVSGFGTVITGTLLSGSIALGDRLDLLPRGMTLRVRSLQVHGERVEEVLAGQRAAVNLAGIDQDQLQRGDVLASPGTLKSTMMLDARLHHLSSSPRALQQRTRVRVYSGAAEVMARLTPLEEEIIEPGQSSLVQLRLEEPLAVDAGGIFILRSYSPMTTIAGGTIIDPHPHKKTRFREAQVAALRIREQGDPLQQAMQQLYTLSPTLPDREAFLHSIPNLPEAADLLEELIAEEQAVILQADRREIVLASRWLNELAEQTLPQITRFHQANPLKTGMPREELRSRILRESSSRLFLSLLLLWESEGKIRLEGQTVATTDFTIRLSQAQLALKTEILLLFTTNQFAPPSFGELTERYRNNRDWQAVMDLLLSEGSLLKINEDLYFATKALREAEKVLKEFLSTHSELTLADYRDLLSTSRKYALSLLEYFDEQKITIRQGEKRILRSNRT